MSDESQQPIARVLQDLYFRWKERGNLLIIIALALAIGVTILIALLQAPPPVDNSKIGLHLLLDDGRGSWDISLWDEHIAKADEALADDGFVVQLVRSDNLDTERWQQFLDLCETHNLTPIIRLATTWNPDEGYWEQPPADSDGRYQSIAEEYADFVAELDWHTEQPIVILLNEPNNGVEWGGTPDPAAYARFLVDTSAAIRDANPNVQILNAALDLYAPNTNGQPFMGEFSHIDADTFMEAVIAEEADVFVQIDIWNSHAYPMGAFREAPWVQAYEFEAINGATLPENQPPRGIFNRGINGYEWELWKLSTLGVEALPVMITETGWRHSESIEESSLDAGEGYPTAEIAARYLDIALQGNNGRYPALRQDGWTPLLRDERVMGVVIFALNGNPAEWGYTNLLQVNMSGDLTGTYPAFNFLSDFNQ